MPNNDYKKLDETPLSKWQYLPQKICVLVMFIITCIFNGLTGAGKLGKSQKTLSDKYWTLITPPDYTFAIWGVIYFFWAVFVLLQFVPNRFLSQPKMFYSNSFKGNKPCETNQQDFGFGFALLFSSTSSGASPFLRTQKQEWYSKSSGSSLIWPVLR